MESREGDVKKCRPVRGEELLLAPRTSDARSTRRRRVRPSNRTKPEHEQIGHHSHFGGKILIKKSVDQKQGEILCEHTVNDCVEIGINIQSMRGLTKGTLKCWGAFLDSPPPQRNRQPMGASSLPLPTEQSAPARKIY